MSNKSTNWARTPFLLELTGAGNMRRPLNNGPSSLSLLCCITDSRVCRRPRRRPHCHYLHAIIFSQTLPLSPNDDDADGFFTGRVMRVSSVVDLVIIIINIRQAGIRLDLLPPPVTFFTFIFVGISHYIIPLADLRPCGQFCPNYVAVRACPSSLRIFLQSSCLLQMIPSPF